MIDVLLVMYFGLIGGLKGFMSRLFVFLLFLDYFGDNIVILVSFLKKIKLFKYYYKFFVCMIIEFLSNGLMVMIVGFFKMKLFKKKVKISFSFKDFKKKSFSFSSFKCFEGGKELKFFEY